MLQVTPARRRSRGAAADELLVEVRAGESGETRLDDGTTLVLSPAELCVDGPDRDVLVIADGRHVQRFRGTHARVDLSAAADIARVGWTPDRDALTREVERDETTGLRHRYDTTPIAPSEGDSVTVWLRSDETLHGGRLEWWNEDDSGEVALEQHADGRWFAEIPPQMAGALVRYRITVDSGAGSRDVSDAAPDFAWPRPGITFLRPPRTTFAYGVGVGEPQPWLRDAVVYHLLVDRFAAPDGGEVTGETGHLGFAGGSVAGAAKRLDHIADLGADVVLVSPITAGDMHVCYDVRDHMAVDSRLGTTADARAFCEAAHDRGIRVILDWEASYFGARHPFVESARKDPASPQRDWFLRDREGRLLGWYGGNPTFIPVDHDNADARRHLIEAAAFWLDLGFDGFRLDSAHAASFGFWSEFALAVRKVAPDAATFVEATKPLPFCRTFAGRSDAFLDFELHGVLRGFAGKGTSSASELDSVISSRDALSDILPLSFIESHDCDRFTAEAGAERLLLALTLLLTLPQTPLLYYGTEVGLLQKGVGNVEAFARTPMPWGDSQDRDLFAKVRDLVQLRRRSRAVRSGDRRTLRVDDARRLYAYARTIEDEAVVVVANADDSAHHLTLGGRHVTVDPLSALIIEGRYARDVCR